MTYLNRKKVLFLITKSNWGGAQRYVYDLVTHLDTQKFEPMVALGGDGTLKELLLHAGIKVITIKSLERDVSFRKEWQFATELYKIIRTEKPNILHVNSSKAGAVGTFVGRIARVPKIVFTAHGWAFNEDRPLWQRLLIKSIHFVTVLLSHRTIAVSKAIVTQMNWPTAQNKMKVINPGRTIGAMYPKVEAREHLANFFPLLKNHLNETWLVTIAELHPIKRLDILIESLTTAASLFPHLRSVIIGEGQEHEALQALIEKNNLTERVFLIGAISEAARFLKAADVFILPSRSESYGYVLHEAGLATVPIIATNVGGIPDIISSEKEGLLIPPNNSKALTAAITSTLQDGPSAKMRAVTLKEKLQNRTVEKMTIATEAIYEL